MKFRFTLRENTLALKEWLAAPGLRIRTQRYRRGWKLQGRTNDVYQGGVRFWMDVRRFGR